MSTPDPSEYRRWMKNRMIGSSVGLALLFGGLATSFFTSATWLGLGLLFAAAALQLILGRWNLRKARALAAQAGHQWWYDRRTRRVVDGRNVRGLGLHLDGPYATSSDAARSREIAKARAAEWNAED